MATFNTIFLLPGALKMTTKEGRRKGERGTKEKYWKLIHKELREVN